ncbi:GNAT family N-acetyltransferase [Falsiroseomonas selenitidurans]|uniref:GNAT family N-acetyltransferase n=1 Tax=Falsiroseomonas selenitidurans TaxID=2716335 RepID=A0ABX1E4V8_9PROT|nr:GNAT family N-acetyltransferase [Falsiroseomonas selenitidurans]NKC30547.1 GNAT family N-acetyltransferase [Falsiroseomonas selenitidurans]
MPGLDIRVVLPAGATPLQSPGRSAGEALRLLPPGGSHLPGWCDAFLLPPDAGDLFATRLWYDTTLAHAVPAGAVPLLGLCAAQVALLPLLRGPRGLTSLTTPYSLAWRPLPALLAGPTALQTAGASLGAQRRFRPPMRLEALAEDAPGLADWRDGLQRAGLRVLPYRHFGNWHEVLRPGAGWEGYLADRPPALRTTIRRKLDRARRDFRFEMPRRPGPALEAGIAGYLDVLARSWKPAEPSPGFDPALMRAAAAEGLLRLGLLRLPDGTAVAAQYWIVSGRRAWLLKLAHDEASRAASPGTALTAMMIRHLIEEDAVQELDFGRGDDAYKKLWVGTRRQRIGLVLAHSGHPAGLLAIARQTLAGWRR